MEYDMRSETAIFWREIYLTALGSGHPDPAAAADEAFLAFDCRFSESVVAGANTESAPEGIRFEETGPLEYVMTYVGTDGVERSPPTADELVLQASEIETVTPSVVVSDPPVQNPSTEGLPAFEWKPDDEVLG